MIVLALYLFKQARKTTFYVLTSILGSKRYIIRNLLGLWRFDARRFMEVCGDRSSEPLL